MKAKKQLDSRLKFKVGDTVWYEDISGDSESRSRTGVYKIIDGYVSEHGEKLYTIKSGKRIGEGIFEEELE